MNFESSYREKRVLITGHTGFKGSWLSLWLSKLGAKVSGVALDPTSANDRLFGAVRKVFERDFREDLRNAENIEKIVESENPDFVFHLAAQPLVIESYKDPLTTVSTNVGGTANLLNAIRNQAPQAHTVVVTTDKCYENKEWSYPYRETDELGGRDIYAASKAATEIITSAFSRSFFESDKVSGKIATARGGNVIGGGDYASDRIFPDVVRSLAAGQPVSVRNPHATRPWQHVLDCLSGYLTLGAWLAIDGGDERAFNFGPTQECERTVEDLVNEILNSWGGEWEHTQAEGAHHEACRLRIAIDLASAVLGWNPVWGFDETVKRTVDWYQLDSGDSTTNDLKQLMEEQIKAFSVSQNS